RVCARSGAHMARALRWPDLVGLGLGGMVGAGVFVTTGRATRLYVGRASCCRTPLQASARCSPPSATPSSPSTCPSPAAPLATSASPSHQESSAVNMALTAVHVAFILFIVVMGFWRGDGHNLTRPADPAHNPGGFFPHGAAGVFNGAAMVYRSYIGYDAVSTMAEEVERPARDIPVGVSGSVVLVTILYCLMAVSMAMLLPYDAIDTEAPFSAAFKGSSGWGWVSNVIGAGASLGILTSLMVAMLGQVRYLCVIGRSGVMPAWLAKVHPGTATPINASAFLIERVFTAALAMFTELDVLLNLIPISMLFVFYMVTNAVVYRCSCRAEAGGGVAKAGLLAGCGTVVVATVGVFHALVPQAHEPELWGVPGMPWVPATSVFLNVFLLGSLDRPSYVGFGFFSAAVALVYVFYSVHVSYDAEESGAAKMQDEAGCKILVTV
ncbi:hypothetical protein ABZP36_008660, partial [Zizania latifolia]